MPRGSRPGERRGGRKKGTPNKRTQAIIAVVEKNGGEMPLDFMLRVMRNKKEDLKLRGDMAKAAAPYLYARLSPADGSGRDGTVDTIDLTKLTNDELAIIKRAVRRDAQTPAPEFGGDRGGRGPAKG